MVNKKITKEQLLQVPKREWNKTIVASSVYVIPSRRKHDSGWTCMDFVADTEEGLVRFGGSCDDVSLKGEHFRMDCLYPSRIIRIWNTKRRFTISHDLSSIDFTEQGGVWLI